MRLKLSKKLDKMLLVFIKKSVGVIALSERKNVIGSSKWRNDWSAWHTLLQKIPQIAFSFQFDQKRNEVVLMIDFRKKRLVKYFYQLVKYFIDSSRLRTLRAFVPYVPQVRYALVHHVSRVSRASCSKCFCTTRSFSLTCFRTPYVSRVSGVLCPI